MLDRNVVVGQRIRALRMQKGLGQSQAAKMIGISQSHLSNIEGGRSHVTLENLFALRDLLEVKMSDFFVDIDKDIKTASASSVGACGEPVVTLSDMIEALNMLKEKHA